MKAVELNKNEFVRAFASVTYRQTLASSVDIQHFASTDSYYNFRTEGLD